MKRGDIYLISLESAFGHEQKGTRPVLVVSPDKFNAFTRAPIVVPITSGGKFAREAGFTVSLMDSGIRTTGVIRCDQPRTVDLVARGARRLESVPAAILDEALALLAPLFQ